MVERTISSTRPEAVVVEEVPGGLASDVWLRRGAEQVTADAGPDPERSVTWWEADEVHFRVAGTPGAGEVESRFDELWAAHEHDGEAESERIAALEVASADLMAAVMELGDMLGGE